MRTLGLGLGLSSGGAPKFNPGIVPGLLQYVDATSGITIVTGISNWADKSGNGNAFVQGSSGAQPAFTASDAKFNGKPSVALLPPASGGKFLQSTYAIPAVNTVILVTYQNPPSSGGGDYSYDSGGGATHRLGCLSTGIYMYSGTLVQSSVGFDSNAHAIAAVWNGASSVLYVDSTAAAAASGNPGNSSAATSAFLGLGFTGTGAIGVRMNYSGALTAAQISYLFKGLAAQNWGTGWS